MKSTARDGLSALSSGRSRQLGPGASLRVAVVTTLREAIIHRTLQSGTHLVEEEVANRLNVSRNPVREAFRSLEQEGFLVSYPGSGVYVAEPSPDEGLDLLEVRGALDSLGAELAARRSSPLHEARLQDVIRRGKVSLAANDLASLVDLNSEFHLATAELSGNSQLMSLLPAMNDRIRWLFSTVAQDRVVASWEEHEEIASAIAAGKTATAGKLARQHVGRTQAAYAAR
jgi:DNA-binding GntR family transcriptional regulator